MDPPEQPHMSPRPRRQSLRGASARASAALIDQLASSPPESPAAATSDADPFGEPFRSSKKDNVKVYGGKRGFRGANGGASRSAIAPPALPMHHKFASTSKKRLLSDTEDLSSSDESTLTPLPSSKSATPLLRSKSMGNLKQGASSQQGSESSISIGPARRNSRPKPPPHTQGLSVLDSASGSMKTGSFVYVLIGVASNTLAEEPVKDDEHAPQRMWWPGFVSRPNPLQITLFFGASSSGPVDVPNPSERIVRDARSCHFTSSTFLVPPSRPEATGVYFSPRKKQKTDLESRWQAAVNSMTHTQEEDNLEFEAEMGSSPSRPGKYAKLGKGDDKARSDDDMVTDPVDVWLAPPHDPCITIPGHGVLSRDKPNATEYWPAQILDYKVPKKPKEKGLYLVKFLDGTEKHVPREWFYLEFQEHDFAFCKLGKFKSEHPEVEADTEHEDQLDRGPSPEPMNPPPNQEDFDKLSIREELSYAKPILTAVLNDEYKPARRHHADFIRGGKSREAVVAGAAARGTVSPKHVAALQGYIIRWVIEGGATASQEVGPSELDNDKSETGARKLSPSASSLSLPVDTRASSPLEAPPSSYAPTAADDQEMSTASTHSDTDNAEVSTPFASADDAVTSPLRRGCDAYEALQPLDKLGYCQNVLLPEALLQILLWREGKRHSINLLSDKEEDELHQMGLTLLNQTDWVNDIVRVRDSISRRLKKNMAAPAPETISGTRSRPRKGPVVRYR